MADAPPPVGISVQDIIETARSVWQALIGPAGLVITGGLWAAWQWLFNRKDAGDAARARRVETESAAELAERTRQDKVDADQNTRLTDEIIRKDKRLAELERSDLEGWSGLRRLYEIARTIRHDGNANAALLCLKLEAAELPVPELRVIPQVPDLDELTGRKKP